MHTTIMTNGTEKGLGIFADFHTHILPGIDDGALDVEESVAMLLEERRQADLLFGENSRCIVFLTPHFKSYNQTVDEFLLNRVKAMADLRNAIETHKDPQVRRLAETVELVPGAEILVHSELESVEGLDRLFMGESNILLFEFSEGYFSSSYIQVIERLCYKYKAGPMLAHFERYASFMQREDYHALMSLNRIIFQFNTKHILPKGDKGLCKHMSSPSVDLVLKFFRYGVPMVPGSDCHDPEERKPNCINGYVNAKKFMKKAEYSRFLAGTQGLAEAIAT